jgi:tetratricopeptide (TPR) repeat protein
MRSFFLLIIFLSNFTFAYGDFEKAEKLFHKGNYDQAKNLFESYLNENPFHAKTIEYLGDIEGMNHSWDKAIFYYEKLKKLKPKEANYYYKYGGVLGMKAKECNKFKALGMISEIRESFEKALVLNPNHIEARWALIELYLQLPAIVGGSESKAQRYSNELMKLSPVDGYLSNGHIAEYFERYTEAEKKYKKAIEIGGSATTYQKLADLYKNKMNQSEKAKQLLLSYKEKNN